MLSSMRRVVTLVVFATLAASVPPAAAQQEGASPPPPGHGAYGTRSRQPGVAESKARAAAGRTPARLAPDGRSPAAPVEDVEFQGITGDGNIAPGDPTGAAGPNNVVTAVNVRYAVYDRTGAVLRSPAPLKSLVSLPSAARAFDPKVVYDHYRGRFVLVYLAGRGPSFGTSGTPRSWIVVASIPQATADDPSTYCVRRVNGDQVPGAGQVWADYPGVGFDKRRVYVSTNQFNHSNDGFRYAQIVVLPKGRLYDCNRTPRIEVFARGQTKDPEGTRAFTIQPAVSQTGVGADHSEYLVSFQDRLCGNTLCGNRVTLWRVVGQPPKLRKRSIHVGRSELAPLGTQKGGSVSCVPIKDCWDTGDLRLINAFYDADRGLLYAAHAVFANIANDPYIESVIRWYELDPRPWGSAHLVERGRIGESQRDLGWPTVATDANGRLFVAFSRAGTPEPNAEYLSAWAAVVQPGSPGGDQVELAAGEETFIRSTDTFQRWGDYNAADRDPTDHSKVWMVNQYAKDNGGPPNTNVWQQVVHQVHDG
jgi:hypothetical protein